MQLLLLLLSSSFIQGNYTISLDIIRCREKTCTNFTYRESFRQQQQKYPFGYNVHWIYFKWENKKFTILNFFDYVFGRRRRSQQIHIQCKKHFWNNIYIMVMRSRGNFLHDVALHWYNRKSVNYIDLFNFNMYIEMLLPFD